jgi:hypothetical protein
MLNGSKLISALKENEMIKSWNILGPFEFDVSDKVEGLVYFENKWGPNSECQVGRKEFAEIFDKNLTPLTMIPHEGDKCVAYGIENSWHFLSSPEELYFFGNFIYYNYEP